MAVFSEILEASMKKSGSQLDAQKAGLKFQCPSCRERSKAPRISSEACRRARITRCRGLFAYDSYSDMHILYIEVDPAI